MKKCVVFQGSIAKQLLGRILLSCKCAYNTCCIYYAVLLPLIAKLKGGMQLRSSVSDGCPQDSYSIFCPGFEEVFLTLGGLLILWQARLKPLLAFQQIPGGSSW